MVQNIRLLYSLYASVTSSRSHADFRQIPSNVAQNLHPLQTTCLGNDTRSCYESKKKTVSELKVALEKTWENFPQNTSVQSFRNRLRECSAERD